MAQMKIGKWEYDEEELERQFKEARRRGAERLRDLSRARSARYDRETNRLIIELLNGATFIVPCDLIQGLRDAAPDLIAGVEVMPHGLALHWEELDQDFSVAGLLAGIFGNQAWMAELGRKGGSVTSEAKVRAARENGRRGGRPRRSAG